jgi:hypothetical protein
VNTSSQDRRRALLATVEPSLHRQFDIAVSATAGPLIRLLLPGLWGSKPRVVGVYKQELIIVATTMNYRRIKRVTWLGPRSEVSAQELVFGTLVRLLLPVRDSYRKQSVLVHGRSDCQAVMRAF